jgi:hypothetical protein
MSYLTQLNKRVAAQKREPETALLLVAKAAAGYAMAQKWTPEAEAKIQAERAAHKVANPDNPTAHADSVPRGKRDEARHQKELQAENWHTKTMAQFRDHSDDALKHIRQDAHEAAELGEKMNPPNPKSGQYRDEVHYAGMELSNRQKHRATKKAELVDAGHNHGTHYIAAPTKGKKNLAEAVKKNWDMFDAKRKEGNASAKETPKEAPPEAAKPATDFKEHPEAKKLRKDFVQSMATIAGVDSGKDKGWNRSLFVNSIAGKIKRVNKTNPEMAKHLLDFVKTTQEKHVANGGVMKPVFAANNSIWTDVGLPK